MVQHDKKKGCMEVHGYKPCYPGHPLSDKKDGRYLWGRIDRSGLDSFTVGLVDHVSEDVVEAYTLKETETGYWSCIKVSEDDASGDGEQVATIAEEKNSFFGGVSREVYSVHIDPTGDAAVFLAIACSLDDMATLL